MYTFPWTYRLVDPGFVPMPIFDVVTKVVVLKVPATFTLVVRMFEVVSALVK